MISLKRLMFSSLVVVMVAAAGIFAWLHFSTDSAASLSAPGSAVAVPAEAKLDYFYAWQNGLGQVEGSAAEIVNVSPEARLDYFYARQNGLGQVEGSTAKIVNVPPEAKLDYSYARQNGLGRVVDLAVVSGDDQVEDIE